MSRFPDAAHLASWAGPCPGHNESAGKRYSGSTRKGNRYLRRVLTQSAWSLKRKKNCFLTALFWRIATRGGSKKAAIAVAHRILTIAWHIIHEGILYQEIGGHHFDHLHPERNSRRLIRRLQQIGFDVDNKPKAAPPARVPKQTITTTPRSTKLLRPRAPKPADPALCRRCAKWGIDCIHARHAKPRTPATPLQTDSVT